MLFTCETPYHDSCDVFIVAESGGRGKCGDINTKKNPAYATVERFEMKSSSAYARVAISSSH